ncbi:MAG: hypothetical protein WD027_00655 [Gaiellales bacterium]
MNPTTGLDLPAARGRRERIAASDEAARLLAALAPPDRAIRWEDVDLASGVIHCSIRSAITLASVVGCEQTTTRLAAQEPVRGLV